MLRLPNPARHPHQPPKRRTHPPRRLACKAQLPNQGSERLSGLADPLCLLAGSAGWVAPNTTSHQSRSSRGLWAAQQGTLQSSAAVMRLAAETANTRLRESEQLAKRLVADAQDSLRRREADA